MLAFRGRFWRRLTGSARDKRGAVALLFALALVPLTIAVALATDFSFYIQARSQLNLAADAAAMHAVRVAAQSYANGTSTTVAAAQSVGQQAGTQWFTAQLGSLNSASVSANNVSVVVNYNASPPGYSATVSYSGTVATHLGKFIVPSWNIADSSTAVIDNAYIEILLLLDNSSSMLIGATRADMIELEHATPCSLQAQYEQDPMSVYTWVYQAGYGYENSSKIPQPGANNGVCNQTFDGDAGITNSQDLLCFYVPNFVSNIDSNSGRCTNGGGSGPTNASDTQLHTPQAPCAFACHSDPTNAGNDYYALSQSLSPPVTLRLNVVHNAAKNVIQTLLSNEESAGQYLVGIYEFNSSLQVDYPTGGGEADSDLASALTVAGNLTPPVTTVAAPNTNFPVAAAELNQILSQSGDGSSATTPQKYMFIVTDGMSDISTSTSFQVLGTITSASNEQLCQQFKNKGITVYVLYTPYLPIPTPTYLDQGMQLAEPQSTSAIAKSLQACASSPSDYYEASDPADINAALQSMLASTLNSASRISK